MPQALDVVSFFVLNSVVNEQSRSLTGKKGPNQMTYLQIISAVAFFAAMFAVEARAAEPVANWCKGRAQTDCTADVACSWRETITDGVSKTSCIYNAKAARAFVARAVSAQSE